MIEIVRRGASAERARVALFDFDGTISLIRSGWMEVMVPMMVEILAETKSGETEKQLTDIVVEFVGRLTGKQTMYQMIELAEKVEKRGGKPLEPLRVQEACTWTACMKKIEHRIEELRQGRASPEKYLVPGSRALLEGLARPRLQDVPAPAARTTSTWPKRPDLLDVTRYFDGGVYGALDDYKSFSKAILIKRIITSAEAKGEELLGFGDGYVEIEK